MNVALAEARDLLDHVGRNAASPTVALHSLAAAGLLDGAGPATPDSEPVGGHRELLERALRLLTEGDPQSQDEDILAAVDHALRAHQATR